MPRLRGESRIRISGQTFEGIDGLALGLSDCTDVLIDGCHFEDVGQAIIAVDCVNVTILNCTYRHLRGPHGMFAQLDKTVNGKVAGCSGFCDPTVDDPEDIVSVFRSDNARILRNTFEGGGPSGSGSGIMLGDYGGDSILCAGNRLINPGQVGIGVAGGTNVTVARNVIYNAGVEGSNVGLYVNNYSPGPMSDIEVRDNDVDWRRADQTLNPAWDGGTAGPVAGWDSNDWNATVDPDELRTHLALVEG